MNRFYLKPTGSACYDESGITYPSETLFDLKKFLKQAGAVNPRFSHYFGQKNLPKVFTFHALQSTVDRIESNLRGWPLIVLEKNW